MNIQRRNLKNKKTTRLNFKVVQELYNQLRVLALKNDSSIALEAEECLEKGLELKKEEEKKRIEYKAKVQNENTKVESKDTWELLRDHLQTIKPDTEL